MKARTLALIGTSAALLVALAACGSSTAGSTSDTGTGAAASVAASSRLKSPAAGAEEAG